MIDSPCISVCRIDETSRVCVGCGRTLEEISDWQSMSESEKDGVMKNIRERRMKRRYERKRRYDRG